jgi:high-affinity Fe2+/Pb2+ permease
MDQIVVTIIDWTVVPLTSAIPFLASHGILLAVFAGLWALFGYALIRNTARLNEAWTRIRHLPLIGQGLAWLLFLPVLAGLWTWRRGWPAAGRVTLIAGLAAWNLLVLVPRPA